MRILLVNDYATPIGDADALLGERKTRTVRVNGCEKGLNP